MGVYILSSKNGKNFGFGFQCFGLYQIDIYLSHEPHDDFTLREGTIRRDSNSPKLDLKLLLDTTNKALAALKNFKRTVEHWDIIVSWTARNIASLKEWETQLGFTTEYPSYETLDEFSAIRIRTLEAIQVLKIGVSDKNKYKKGLSVKSQVASSKF